MSLPEFVIAGVQRSGTTSLYNWLMAHPQVWDGGEPRRETHYFDYQFNYDRGLGWYRDQFRPGKRQIAGDKSPTYFDHPLVPGRLKKALPDVRVIVCLRNPTDRAWSHYGKARAKGFETLPSFHDALEAERRRLDLDANLYRRERWSKHYYLSASHVLCYLRRGAYVTHLKRWLDVFQRKQLHFVKSEEMFADPATVYAGVLRFLGLREFEPPKWRRFQRLDGYVNMPSFDRAWLDQHFAPLNESLAQVLGDDRWLWK